MNKNVYLGFLDCENDDEKGGETDWSVRPSDVKHGAEWPREELRILTKFDSL